MLIQPWVIGSALGALLLLPALVSAQTAMQPTRPFRGLFGGTPAAPGETRNELSLLFTGSGGYDQNLSDDPDVLDPNAQGVQESGYVATAQAQLKYVRAGRRRSITTIGSMTGTTFEGSQVGFPLSGSLGFQAESQLGRSMKVTGTGLVANDAFYGIGSFDGLRPIVGPDGTPGNGTDFSLISQRTWTYDFGAGARQPVGRRSTLIGNYRVYFRRFADSSTDDASTLENQDSFQQTVSAAFERSFSRAYSIGLNYTHTGGEYRNADGTTRPYSDHTVGGDLRYSRQLSRSQSLSLSGGGGATYVTAIDDNLDQTRQTWNPAARASMRLTVGRSWSIGGDYARSLTVLDGITDETYFSDTGNFTANGQIAQVIGLSMNLAISRGVSGGAVTAADYSSYTGSITASYNVSRMLFVSLGYLYYRYQIGGGENIASGIPVEYERQGVRLSLSTFVPLFGSFNTAR